LDDVELVRVEEGRQWLPQISTDGVKNSSQIAALNVERLGGVVLLMV
jgi:hypothetical protein